LNQCAPIPAAPTATPGGAPAATNTPRPPTESDGIYTAATNREIYTKISTDYQEIVKLTNRVTEGQPLPAGEILSIYEESKLARLGTQTRPLRGFAREAARTREFPDAVAYYCSHTFLDDPVIDAITGTRSAANYSPEQRRQAIQKGIQRTIYHWSRRYIQNASVSLSPGLVDEAWAIYVGERVDGGYPNSLAATARSRETNFNRPGSLDDALRKAMSDAQQAAAAKDAAAYERAANEVYSRFHAIFYLGTARYMNESVKSVQAGNAANAGVQLVEGFSFYQSIQPTVAKADAAADKTIVAFFTGNPADLTAAKRDEALAALNRTAGALLLKDADLVTPATFN
jgi:hypothetical protein